MTQITVTLELPEAEALCDALDFALREPAFTDWKAMPVHENVADKLRDALKPEAADMGAADGLGGDPIANRSTSELRDEKCMLNNLARRSIAELDRLAAIEGELRRRPGPEGFLPKHLRKTTPPTAVCDNCGRKTWAHDQLGRFCEMPQPDGTVCTGQFIPFIA
jgi:hypothetical protein